MMKSIIMYGPRMAVRMYGIRVRMNGPRMAVRAAVTGKSQKRRP